MQNTIINPNNSFIVLVYGIFRMSRPAQLLAIILVYLFGSIVAWAHNASPNRIAFVYGLLVVLLVSASIHIANEYADYETDALSQRTLYSGGSGALQDLDLHPRVALISAWTALLLGVILALLGLLLGLLTPAALMVLFAGAFLGWMYSLRPLKLAWRGWGELDNAFLGGVALPFYAYLVQSAELDPWEILIFIPFCMLVFINLLATTWADRRADQAVGKFTLATRWKRTRLRLVYLAVATGAFVYLAAFNLLLYPQVVFIASFLVVPVVIWGFVTYTRQNSPFPTVAAMAVYLLIQIAAWGSVLVRS
jgi:1,4-dihydroxy-2-naphthoate octaprenyltransferase